MGWCGGGAPGDPPAPNPPSEEGPGALPLLRHPLGGCPFSPHPGKGVGGPVLCVLGTARGAPAALPRPGRVRPLQPEAPGPAGSGGDKVPGPGSASPGRRARSGKGQQLSVPTLDLEPRLGPHLSVYSCIRASIPPLPHNLGGATGPSSHAPNSGPCSSQCRKGEPEFSSVSLPPRPSLQRCSIPPPPPAPSLHHPLLPPLGMQSFP